MLMLLNFVLEFCSYFLELLESYNAVIAVASNVCILCLDI